MEAEPKKTREMLLDALQGQSDTEGIVGIPSSPVLPLVGSLNVPISEEEEEKDE